MPGVTQAPAVPTAGRRQRKKAAGDREPGVGAPAGSGRSLRAAAAKADADETFSSVSAQPSEVCSAPLLCFI